jgi:hypothetical protein
LRVLPFSTLTYPPSCKAEKSLDRSAEVVALSSGSPEVGVAL